MPLSIVPIASVPKRTGWKEEGSGESTVQIVPSKSKEADSKVECSLEGLIGVPGNSVVSEHDTRSPLAVCGVHIASEHS
jgi:hypothetical protein